MTQVPRFRGGSSRKFVIRGLEVVSDILKEKSQAFDSMRSKTDTLEWVKGLDSYTGESTSAEDVDEQLAGMRDEAAVIAGRYEKRIDEIVELQLWFSVGKQLREEEIQSAFQAIQSAVAMIGLSVPALKNDETIARAVERINALKLALLAFGVPPHHSLPQYPFDVHFKE